VFHKALFKTMYLASQDDLVILSIVLSRQEDHKTGGINKYNIGHCSKVKTVSPRGITAAFY
jgi:hypothetical protein